MTYAEAEAILHACPDEHKAAQLETYGCLSEIAMRDGAKLQCCTNCWNAHVAARKQARKEELAAFRANQPKCQRCGVKPVTWYYGPYRLCGRCKTATEREHSRSLSGAGMLGIFATSPLVDTSNWAGRK